MSDTVEIVIPVEPCKEYIFDMKIISPQNKEIGKITGLELENLPNIDEYIPPPLTSVVLVNFIGGGKHTVTTQPTSPVPESCLPDYMEALDAYADRLETVANDEHKKNTAVRRYQFHEQQKVELTQAEMLTQAGCVCSSPRLELRVVPGSRPQSSTQKLAGVYLYEGEWEGRPFYKLDLEGRSTGEFIPLQTGNKRQKRFIGRVDGGGTTTTRRPWNYGGSGGAAGSWSSSSSSSTSWSSSSGGRGKYSSSSSSHGSSNTGRFTTRGNSRITTTMIPIQRVSTPAPLLPRYLYWEPAQKQWLVSPQAGLKESGAELSTEGRNKLKCPGDGAQAWRVKGSGARSSWTPDSSLELVCAPTF